MTQERRNAINALSDEVRQYLSLDLPIDVDDAIKKLGGSIVEVDEMKDGGEAFIKKTGSRSFEITIHSENSDTRKRFTKAHELGHLFLHMGYMIDEKQWNTWGERKLYRDSAYLNPRYSVEEIEAHEFAASLLMPKKEFTEVVQQNTQNRMCNIKNVADKFNVSVDAAKTRGRWLGILSWE